MDGFQCDIIYRRPTTRRHSILPYITRVAAFPPLGPFLESTRRLQHFRDGKEYHNTTGTNGKVLCVLIYTRTTDF